MNGEQVCQSCGMPLRETKDFGFNEDGTKNHEFCHLCFKYGRFTDEGITMEQKIEELVKLSVQKFNMPEDEARGMAESIIPELSRWKNNSFK